MSEDPRAFAEEIVSQAASPFGDDESRHRLENRIVATFERLIQERDKAAELADKLRGAIMLHRGRTRGHGSCWENDLELWEVIDPGTVYPHGEVPPWCEFMKKCAEYRAGLEEGGDGG